VLLILIVACIAAQQPTDAAELLARMEERIAKAKTLRIRYRSEVKVKGEERAFSTEAGALLMGEDNRLRLRFTGEFRSKESDVDVVSDGATVKAVKSLPGDRTLEIRAHPKLGEHIRVVLTRGGLSMALLPLPGARNRNAESVEEDIRSAFAVSDAKVAREEGFGDRKAKVITYKLAITGNDGTYTGTLWLDTKAVVPLKLSIAGAKGGREFVMVDVYEEFALDAEVDAAEFRLP
jgi:outer membrane lipoprotein-sorting protein